MALSVDAGLVFLLAVSAILTF